MNMDVITYVHWLIFSMLLIIIELILPGVFFIWFGLGALTVGIALILFSFPFTLQLLLFALLSLGFSLLVMKFFRRGEKNKQAQLLNLAAGSEYIGQIMTVNEAVQNRLGRLKIGDSVWNISGPDCPAGTEIVITGVSANSLTYAIHEKSQ